ncbi:MAG: excinuclease ABC subunit UvrA [Microlunatus sp.]
METPTGSSTDGIAVRGARLHNLRDVDVDIPRNQLVAVTGVSGSGKSSLAFGTIHAEAQRRYFDSVAPFARRLIHQATNPRVRQVTGLPPAVALQQTRGGGNARSTVGTVTTLANTVRMLFSRAGVYPAGLARLDSDHFSANTTVGACPECDGLGQVHRATEASMVPDPSLSIAEKAIASWPGAWLGKNYRDILDTLGYDIHRPWRELSPEDRQWILFTEEEPVVTVHSVREAGRIQRPYEGKYLSAERHLQKSLGSGSATTRERAMSFVEAQTCPLCHGRRLRADALSVTWRGEPVDGVIGWQLDRLHDEARSRLTELGADAAPTSAVAEAEETLLEELLGRLEVLVELGLGHLSLGRPTASVSAGELQRLRLATLLGTGLFGVVYVLDEPSAGLHPTDSEALRQVVRRLVDGGNSVLLVEHDRDLIRACDWVVDVGPGAGRHGGYIIYSGPVAGLVDVPDSLTGAWLHRAFPSIAEPRSPGEWLQLTGIRRNNLYDLEVGVPLRVLTAVTGVSGAGKTSLLDAIADQAGERRLVRITQQPIGRTPRSNLATYTGLFDHVRKLFAATAEAKERGFGVSRFSFNVAEGRCPTCQGEGMVEVGLMFLPGSYAPCQTCGGSRYLPETLEVRWQGLTVAELLELSVEDALTVFTDAGELRRTKSPTKGTSSSISAVLRSLRALDALGLGYLGLGQPATELSGGEAQRIKLATELQRSSREHTLYLLDEPTTGLHPADRERLTAEIHRLVDAGNTVVVAEHDRDVISAADWVLDLGPGAGDRGGRVVYAGPPAGLSDAAESLTGRHLQR